MSNNHDPKDNYQTDALAYAESMGWGGPGTYEKLEEARKKVPHWEPNMPNPKHPSHMPPRPDSVIDLDFRRSNENKIKALIALGQSANMLGKTFKLKQKYIHCTHYLQKENIKFEVVFDDEPVTDKDLH